MRLSYLLTPTNRPQAIRGILARLCEITTLPPGQWEICIAGESDAAINYIRNEFPAPRILRGATAAACSGQYIVPLGENNLPIDAITVSSILSHLDSNPDVGAVVGKFTNTISRPSLPTLVQFGATGFRRTLLERIGGLSPLRGSAADYDLSFRILSANSRIDHREDILFQSDPRKSPGLHEIADLLGIARRYLPENLSEIYWQDWAKKYKALAAHSKKKSAGRLAPLLARVRAIKQSISPPEPVSSEIIETVFGFRRHAALIGDWARRSSVWRVILADFSENIWATYNACRSSGLQMRCLADNDPAYDKQSYRDLPIVPANRAFEGGGIDGVILTSTDPTTIEANFKSLRNFFPGPILRLCQTPRQATHAQATAA
jgi:hypothetical protein